MDGRRGHVEFHHPAAEVVKHVEQAAPVVEPLAERRRGDVLPLGDDDELDFARVIALDAERFLQRRHGDEGVDPVMPRRFEPRGGVTVREQVTMKIDDDAVDLGPRHRAAEVDAGAVVLGDFRRRGWLGEGHE